MAITFVSFQTFVDPSFWNEINKKKLNDWKLDDSTKTISGSFTTYGKQIYDCCLHLEHEAFSSTSNQSGEIRINGEIKLTNTLNDFQHLDRKEILHQLAKKLWAIITSNEWLTNPDALNIFYFTAYADLKHFIYYYWNCIPALLYPHSIEHYDTSQVCTDESLLQECHNFSLTNNLTAFVLINQKPEKLEALSDKMLSSNSIILVIINPSTVYLQPGYNLRNLISALAFLRKDWNSVKVLCLRKGQSESFYMHVKWHNVEDEVNRNEIPTCVGWERNKHGQLSYASVDLKSTFDPVKIMEQSVELNLKLIRWRLVPNIDLQKFYMSKILMLGSGTLGCNLARALLGWGFKNFFFVDNAKISFNNPTRQSLFQFEDCVHGNKSKAATAAEALQKIYPLVNASYADIKIPMPGHPVSQKELNEVKRNVDKLDELIRTHDIIFLVMDSRESRWLPTLLASVYNKLAITVALGFDTFVVIRHGVCDSSTHIECPSTSDNTYFDPMRLVLGNFLGCYYCSDVTAPGNSTTDRTLDQQCTITRAGLSMIASGMAVELLTSVLQHELGPAAPARLADVDENSSVLGATPHQIRGFLSRFSIMTPTVRRFEKCTACGDAVKECYKRDGFDFLNLVFDNPAELEKITGLTELHSTATDLQMDILEYDDSESITSSI